MRARLTVMALVVAALAPAAPALADPPPPAPPGLIPEPSGIGNALAQSGTQPGGPLGLPDLAGYGNNLLLGQNPQPAAPDAPASPVIPSLNAFDPAYLLGQNQQPAAPGEGTAAPGLGPDADSPGAGRIAFLRRIYLMYQAGELRGALLGQQPPEEFAAQASEPDAPTPPG